MSSCLLLLLLPVAMPDDEPFEPPLSGRPENFRGAVGLFRINASADRTRVEAGKPIHYTVRISADAGVPVLAPPTRPEVEKEAAFRRHFHVEPADPFQQVDEKKHTWEFSYLLKPKSEEAKVIPELPFCFFNPQFGSDPKGYQERSARAIAITVTPAQMAVPQFKGREADSYPEAIRWMAGEDQLLARHEPWTPPGAAWLLVLLLAPPLAALSWLLVWRRLYPDAARRAKLRRSRAAREALKALHTARSAQGVKLAERVAGIVALYLGQRFDLPTMAPTPAEVDGFLRGALLPDELREQAAALLQTCDALRFSAVPPAVSGSLADTAQKLILDLEAFSWSLLPS
jgi:hypothetical protein